MEASRDCVGATQRPKSGTSCWGVGEVGAEGWGAGGRGGSFDHIILGHPIWRTCCGTSHLEDLLWDIPIWRTCLLIHQGPNFADGETESREAG